MKFKDYLQEILQEDLSKRTKERTDNVNKQKLSRERDNEFIGNEFAKRDINTKFFPAVDSGDKEGTLKTKISVDIDDQKEANKLLKKLGFDKTHWIQSATTAGGRF